MGYMRHHAILVTSFDSAALAEAHAFAKRACGSLVSPIVKGWANEEATFVVVPDGSKEGWEPSDEGDARRADLVRWLREQAYEDGSNRFAWAEVQYGDDDWDDKLLRSARLDQAEFRTTPAGVAQYGPVSTDGQSGESS